MSIHSSNHLFLSPSVSSLGLAGIFTILPSSLLIDYFGYRRLLTLTLLPISASWFMQALAPSITVLYIGRIISGFGLMLYTAIIQPLMTELVEPTYRGFMGCGSEIVGALGILLAYLMADFLNWKLVTLLSALPFIPIFFLSLGVPEVRKGWVEGWRKAMWVKFLPLGWVVV